MHNTPTPDELLDVVARYLTEVAMPLLPPAAAFHARVAANAVNVVRRQIALGPAQDAAERERLRALLGPLPGDDLGEANRALAEAIAQGRVDRASSALVAHLWQTTLDRLAVDQPGYASYRAETGGAPTGD
jgi:DNA-binding FadR family transcriptional regulator